MFIFVQPTNNLNLYTVFDIWCQECKDGLFHVECGHVKTTTNHIQDVSFFLLETSYYTAFDCKMLGKCKKMRIFASETVRGDKASLLTTRIKLTRNELTSYLIIKVDK